MKKKNNRNPNMKRKKKFTKLRKYQPIRNLKEAIIMKAKLIEKVRNKEVEEKEIIEENCREMVQIQKIKWIIIKNLLDLKINSLIDRKNLIKEAKVIEVEETIEGKFKEMVYKKKIK